MKPTAISAYDFQGLAALKHEAKTPENAALKEAAKQFESLFTKMLLQSMREANKSFGNSMFDSEQGDFYEQMFDDQMAVHLSQGKGLGLADMLIRQLTQSGLEARPLPNPPPSHGGGDKNAALGVNASGATIGPATSSPPPYNGGGQGGGASSTALTTSKADFVRMFSPHAQRAAQQLGVDPNALLAQAALETGWGRHVPCNADGSCSFNLFGVKAGAAWTGATAAVPTLEFEEGVAVRKVERFRAYDSPAASFMDYARLVGGSARYEAARGAGADVASFASALQRGGYATDPDYARKIVAVAAEVRALQSAQLKVAAAGPIHTGGGA